MFLQRVSFTQWRIIYTKFVCWYNYARSLRYDLDDGYVGSTRTRAAKKELEGSWNANSDADSRAVTYRRARLLLAGWQDADLTVPSALRKPSRVNQAQPSVNPQLGLGGKFRGCRRLPTASSSRGISSLVIQTLPPLCVSVVAAARRRASSQQTTTNFRIKITPSRTG